MATSRKTSVNKKKKAACARAKKASSGATRGVIGVMLICLGILMFVCLCLPSEASFIVLLRYFVQGIAGSICLVVPLLVLWGGILLVFSAKARVRTRTLICCSVILLVVLTLLQLLQVEDILWKIDNTNGMNRDFATFLNLSFQNSSIMRKGGGVIGALLAWPLWRMLDVWGSVLVLVFILVADVMALTNTSLYHVSAYFEEYFERTREDYHAWREEQRAAKEEQLQMEEQEAQIQAQEDAKLREERSNAVGIEAKPRGDFVPGKEQQNTRKTKAVSSRSDEEPVIKEMPKTRSRRRGTRSPVEVTEDEQPLQAPYSRRIYSEPEDATPDSSIWEDPSASEEALYAKARIAEYDLSAQEETTIDVADEYPALSRKTSASFSYAEPVWGQAASWDGPHLYSEPDDEQDEALSSTQSQEESNGVNAGQPTQESYLEDSENAQMASLQVEGDIEEQPAYRDEFVHTPQETTPRRRRTVLETPAAKKTEVIVPSEKNVAEASMPTQRRLDDTPLVLPKKEENPLNNKPVEEYRFPPLTLLNPSKKPASVHTHAQDEENAKKLVNTLSSFGIQAKVLNVTHGPAITRYELQPAPGVKVSRIVNLVDDIALNMASAGVRIEAPIPGKPAVGIEIPNETISMVALRDVLDSNESANNPSPLACALGKDIAGKNVIVDLAKMPHVLIAGATGSGKSVCINTLINSIIFRATPEEVRLILIDPKVVELSIYNGIPHLLIPVVTDPKKASGALSWAVMEMDHRYKRFAGAGVRDIRGYNANLKDGEEPMAKIVVIIDELADLMMVAPGEVEESICRLAQLARAAGIHLVIATQRPSVNVITGVIKANIPSRIAFAVSSQIDSRTILDGAGAEKLLGKGDMLYAPQGSNKPLRVQGCFVSDEEVTQVVEYVKQRHDVTYDEDVIEHLNSSANEAEAAEKSDTPAEAVDELLQQAIEIAVESGQASISMLQRRLRIGYARAGRLIDEMAKRGIVAQAEGAKPRAVLISREEYRQMFEME